MIVKTIKYDKLNIINQYIPKLNLCSKCCENNTFHSQIVFMVNNL